MMLGNRSVAIRRKNHVHSACEIFGDDNVVESLFAVRCAHNKDIDNFLEPGNANVSKYSSIGQGNSDKRFWGKVVEIK
jgi:hypothetical protein